VLFGDSVSRCYEATIDRDRLRGLMGQRVHDAQMGSYPDVEVELLGSAEATITTRVDVRGHLDLKRRAMAAHASQISETSIFLGSPPEQFAVLWGRNAFSAPGRHPTCAKPVSLVTERHP